MFYKLYARTYDGASDGNIQGYHEHTQNKAKFVTLFDMMLSNFFGKGHHVTCDSTYMGNNMAQVSRKIWKIIMVGTIQANRTDAPMVAYLKANPMKKQTYEYKIWQHNTQSLVAAIWWDNGLVKTLSNYHQPIIVPDGLMRKKMGVD